VGRVDTATSTAYRAGSEFFGKGHTLVQSPF
jgi:hypothetical protein